jgi:hypothetical protein
MSSSTNVDVHGAVLADLGKAMVLVQLATIELLVEIRNELRKRND